MAYGSRVWRQGRSRWWRGYQAKRAAARNDGWWGREGKILSENKLKRTLYSEVSLVKQKKGATFVAPIPRANRLPGKGLRWELGFYSPTKHFFQTPKYHTNVTKAEVIAEISQKTGIEKADVLMTVEAFFKVVKDSMTEGNNIYVRGFGSFVNKKRARKVARNISKNTSLIIEEHYIPSFKPSKTFVAKIKNSKKVKAASATAKA
jgi:DNA-binding protein HU-beta